MKPKINRKGNKHRISNYDLCGTPTYALEPLYPYLPRDWIIWECADGDGNLSGALVSSEYTVLGTDITRGYDFFTYQPEVWDVLITNPPYSVKYDWLERCYQLGKPFALLMPTEMISAARAAKLFGLYGIQVIYMYPRIDFKMPNIGWEGKGAQFPTCWYTWQMNLPRDIYFVDISWWKHIWKQSYKNNGNCV